MWIYISTTFLRIIIKTRPNDPVWNFVKKKKVGKNSVQAAKGGSLWLIKTVPLTEIFTKSNVSDRQK